MEQALLVISLSLSPLLSSQARLTCQEAGHSSSAVDDLTGAGLQTDKRQEGQSMV